MALSVTRNVFEHSSLAFESCAVALNTEKGFPNVATQILFSFSFFSFFSPPGWTVWVALDFHIEAVCPLLRPSAVGWEVGWGKAGVLQLRREASEILVWPRGNG